MTDRACVVYSKMHARWGWGVLVFVVRLAAVFSVAFCWGWLLLPCGGRRVFLRCRCVRFVFVFALGGWLAVALFGWRSPVGVFCLFFLRVCVFSPGSSACFFLFAKPRLYLVLKEYKTQDRGQCRARWGVVVACCCRVALCGVVVACGCPLGRLGLGWCRAAGRLVGLSLCLLRSCVFVFGFVSRRFLVSCFFLSYLEERRNAS